MSQIKAKFKSVVLFLKIICQFIITRPFGNLIHDLARKYNGLVSVSELRKLERLWTKTAKAEQDVNFLKNCKLFNVFPKFTNFKIPLASHHDMTAIRKRLLRSAITRRCKEKNKLDNELRCKVEQIRGIANSVDWYIIQTTIKRNIRKKLENVIKTHEKKLKRLTKNVTLPFTYQETVTNLSSHRLSNEEKKILEKGLSFAIQPPYIKKSDVICTFEQIHYLLSHELKDEEHSGIIKSQLSHLANTYINSYKPSSSDLKKHKILKLLRNNKDIIILKPDKGNGVVIMDRKKYDEAIYKIINDLSKFRKLDKDPTLLREGQLQRFLRKLNKNKILNDEVYNAIYPRGSQPARIYGLPKMHKPRNDPLTPPVRPIVSSIGTFNYNLAKHLSSVLIPLIPTKHCVNDSFTFVQEIKSMNSKDKFLISYDVSSLFTNIPLNETIELAIDLIINNKKLNGISRSDLKKLFSFATSCTHFSFNGFLYDQTDGVAMGSPLAPVLANLFMGHHEDNWLKEYNQPGPEYYRRYVDDIFCIFNKEKDATTFFEYLNTRHANIKFTMERESEGKLSFLDVLISRQTTDNTFKTSVYHKKTYTGLLMNFISFTPFSYKTGLIKTLIDRTYKINNTCQGFYDDLKELTKTFMKNQFPEQIIKRTEENYLQKQNKQQRKTIHPNDPPTNKIYFLLPYIGKYSIITQSKLRNMISNYCKNIDVKLVFSTFKISQMFKNKDRIPEQLKSHVIYQFKCAGCNARYIGETSRHLQTRINEHLQTDKNSHIYKHLQASEQCKNANNIRSCFNILDSASTKFQLKLKEGYYIHINKPELNKQQDHIILKLSL